MQPSSPSTRTGRIVLVVLLAASATVGAGSLLWSATRGVGGLPIPASSGRPTNGASSAHRVEVEFREHRLYGALAFDDVTPLHGPVSGPAPESQLHEETLVIGVVLDGEAKAYPITVLQRHEMVNDVVGTVPVLVTWCPVCGTALVHDRRIDGAPHTFGNHGALYENAMTWFDHQTRSLWSQPSGVALSGSLAGVRLEMLPARVATWGAWKRERPETLIVSEGVGSGSSVAVNPLAEAPEGFVVGIAVGGAAKAYPLDVLVASAPINDRVGGVPVLVYAGPGGALHAFDRRVGGATLEFDRADGRLRDRDSGSFWDAATGEAVEGLRLGAVLDRLPYSVARRWAWRGFYPTAEMYGT